MVMAKGREHHMIEECETRLKSTECVSGVMLELFECANDDTCKPHKNGYISRPTNMNHINFYSGYTNQSGHILMKNRLDAKFWIKDVSEGEKMRTLVGSCLQTKSILKPLIYANIDSNAQSKILVGCHNFDCTLQDWLLQQVANPAVNLLSDQIKIIIRSGWISINDIWEMGLTSGDLDKPTSYVMIGGDITIVPFVLHQRNMTSGHGKHLLRVKFADMVEKHVEPLCTDPELKELISLMKHPNTTSVLFLGHPVFSDPMERQLMYRDCFSDEFTEDQLTAIDEKINVDANWKQIARQDPGLNEIISNHSFSNKPRGALRFAKISACHYGQNLKTAMYKCGAQPPGALPKDRVDNLLKLCLSTVLCQFYALSRLDDGFGV